MTATDELRRLLDERGVEWRGGLPTETMVEADGLDLLYVALPDGRVRAFIRNYLTPGQAIEATLGRGECEQEEHGWSTEGDHARVWLTCGHDCMVETVADLPNYCPNCGARVIGEDA